MPFEHERLEIYHLAVDFLALADEIVEQLPRGKNHIAVQLSRAALSIVNNIAEGAGKFSKPDKRRFYMIATGSATESAAMLDVCLRLQLLPPDRHQPAKQLLDRLVGKLVTLTKNLQPQEDASRGAKPHALRRLGARAGERERDREREGEGESPTRKTPTT